MPAIQHTHDENCKYGSDFTHYLIEAAPKVLWFDVQDVGSYTGSIYGVGEYEGKILIYEDYYGSCSGCGGWGEGGEPENQEAVLAYSKLFDLPDEAKKHLKSIDNSDSPDISAMENAINEVYEYISAKR